MIKLDTLHTRAQIIQRSKGHDVVAKAAYNSRSNIRNHNTGKIHYHRSKGGLVYEAILIPYGSPDWLKKSSKDRGAFWSAVDKGEIRWDAQLARGFVVPLLPELTLQQNIELFVDFVKRHFVNKGMVADISIHEPPKGGDPNNIHGHGIFTMREITPNGFGNKVRAWNNLNLAGKWRESWFKEANLCLERNGFEPRLDPRSFKERNIDREPTRYKGPAYRKPRQKSKDRDGSKGPLDVWKFLRETIEQKSDGRDSKYIENEK